MKPGDLVWVRGVVKQVTPNAVLVTCTGPGGSPIPYAFDPSGPIAPDGELPVAKPA